MKNLLIMFIFIFIFKINIFSINKNISENIEKNYSISVEDEKDIFLDKKYILEKNIQINDICKYDNQFFIVGDNFSGSFIINQDKIEEKNIIENFDYNFTACDFMNNELSIFDNKRKIIFQKDFKYYLDYKLNEINSFCFDGEKIWIYDKTDSKVYIFNPLKNEKKLEALSFMEFKADIVIEGLKVKKGKELWACSENSIFLFDEYFKLRHIYFVDEKISGISFSDNEDTYENIVVYASSKNNGEIYKYILKKY